MCEIARVCRRVPEYPAESFREAVQSVHFLTFCLTIEPFRPFASLQYQLGRPDQYLSPFYCRDKAAGRLTDAEAQTLLDCLLRCPVIPGVNLEEGHYEGIARLANRLRHCEEVHLMPYHPLGISKSEQIGRPAAYRCQEFLDMDGLRPVAEFLRGKVGVPVRIL